MVATRVIRVQASLDSWKMYDLFTFEPRYRLPLKLLILLKPSAIRYIARTALDASEGMPRDGTDGSEQSNDIFPKMQYDFR